MEELHDTSPSGEGGGAAANPQVEARGLERGHQLHPLLRRSADEQYVDVEGLAFGSGHSKTRGINAPPIAADRRGAADRVR